MRVAYDVPATDGACICPRSRAEGVFPAKILFVFPGAAGRARWRGVHPRGGGEYFAGGGPRSRRQKVVTSRRDVGRASTASRRGGWPRSRVRLVGALGRLC